MKNQDRNGAGETSFATRHALAILFIVAALCLAGVFAALHIPASVFPATPFPRIVVNVSDGIMPTDEMMASVTRPVEQAMKSIPGVTSVLSTTTRGSAIINVKFSWGTSMHRAELYVLGRLSEIRSELPPGAAASASRVGFSLSYPIIGISLTARDHNLMDLWKTATYTIKPLFLQIPGVSKVEIVGGRVPEYHVVVDPLKLQAAGLALADVTHALARNNRVASAGFLAQNYRLYLTTVDGRVYTAGQIGNVVVAVRRGHPIRVRDVARVKRAPAPTYTNVSAQGRPAVLFNIESHANASTPAIAAALQHDLRQLHQQLPPDMHLAFYYNQSSFVRSSVSNVWDAVLFGLVLSAIILYLFLKNWGSVWTAVATIPISVLITFIAMKLAGMSFNMMTLGGIAASIGLIIDNSIIVVEAMIHHIAAGRARIAGIKEAMDEITGALIGSTLTPIVVFLPLAYLSGLAGVFFRALGITMVVGLLVSLLLAVTLTPSLAAWLIRGHGQGSDEGGFILRPILRAYERAVRWALRHALLTLLACVLAGIGSVFVYQQLQTGFLPYFDEGGFNIDFAALPGTNLAESARELNAAERIVRANPDVQAYSRELGVQLGPFLSEPNVGSFLIKLKANRKHTTEQVMDQIRAQFDRQFPMVRWDFKGFLTDLVGDLQLAPYPVEIKLFSPNLAWLKATAPRVEAQIKTIPGIVDSFDGLVVSGPAVDLQVRRANAARFGLTTQGIAKAVNNAMLGSTSSYVLHGDHIVTVRVLADPRSVDRVSRLRTLPLRTPTGQVVRLEQVALVRERANEVELNRDNLRQDDIVSARLQGIDLGTAMREVRTALSRDRWLPPGSVEFGGLYQLQQKSFGNLLVVLLAAILLVFTVLVVEFRSFYEPVAIVFGAVLSLLGSLLGLWIGGITLNIVSYLGAIIGIGIVAKNGILVLDYCRQLQAQGRELVEAIVSAGQRRLRPVLMTSLAAALGMVPLAYGAGAGAQMLQPLGVAVIGALALSVVMSLIATPVVYYLLVRLHRRMRAE
ncbi:MAG: efflux RND transporter permease subunit [Acidiferrobacterales bacterium]